MDQSQRDKEMACRLAIKRGMGLIRRDNRLIGISYDESEEVIVTVEPDEIQDIWRHGLQALQGCTKDLCDVIKEIIGSNNVGQAAEKCGMTYQGMKNLVDGQQSMRANTLLKLIDRFSVRKHPQLLRRLLLSYIRNLVGPDIFATANIGEVIGQK